MVNNQEWFNKEYPKEIKEIEIKRENFQGQLIIEDYLELEEIYLYDIRSINKMVLKKLEQLKECTISVCGVQDLVIENCPQLKKLNIRSNSLTNLEFLASLKSLEELELDGNAKLVGILKDYQGDWKIYKKFLDLQKENKDLKESKHQLKEFLKKEVINPLDESIKKAERRGSFSDKKTDELMTITKGEIEKVKGIKEGLETELAEKGSKIQELEKEVIELEKRVKKLTDLNKNQEKKIINSLLQVFPEKELLRELIKIHLEFTKAKKQKQPVVKLKKQKDEIYKELERKLGNDEETMEKIETILTDCEELLSQELELETELNSKTSLIEGQISLQKQMPGNEEKIRQLELELAKAKGQLEIYREQSSKPIQQIFNHFSSARQQLSMDYNTTFHNQFTNIYQIRYDDQQLQKELTELKQIYQALEPTNEPASNPQKLKKAILFLAAKQKFATARKNTISNLIDNYNNLNESGQKFDKMVTLGEYISNAGWIADFIPAPGAGTAVNLLGKGISAIASFFKDNSLTEHAKKFEDYLMEDEKATLLLNETYQSLVNSLQGNQSKINPTIIEMLKLNENQLGSYSVFALGNIQQGEELTMEKMQEAINSLANNLREFTQELQQEKTQYAEKLETLFSGTDGEILQAEITESLNKLVCQEEQNLVAQQPDLANQITIKENALKELINSAKEKLKSRSTFNAKTKEREEKLDFLFESLPTNPEEFIKNLNSIKNGLSKQLTTVEINNLCQIKQELIKLESQPNQQVQIIQPAYGTPGSSK